MTDGHHCSTRLINFLIQRFWKPVPPNKNTISVSTKLDFTAALLGSISDLVWVVVVVVLVVAFAATCLYVTVAVAVSNICTVEPRYNEGLRDWQNLFALTRFRFFVCLFHLFCYYWGKENRFLYQGLCCPRRDFAQKAKSRGGTLVTRAYIRESTYSWNILSNTVNIEKISICLNRGREESVGNKRG